ncbi:MAG: penicillin-binding transpeptidase domain-containing protein, partial [Pseudomonadota bacterium]
MTLDVTYRSAGDRPAASRPAHDLEDRAQAEGAPAPDRLDRHRDHVRAAVRVALVCLCLFVGLAIVTGQLVRLAILGQTPTRVAVSAPISESFARPSILDRNGRPLAIDVLLPSITADPAHILDVDEAVARLGTVLSPADMSGLREKLANRSSRFAWVARKVSTALAERINNLGLPGITFRWETKRTYPQGTLAGHVLGAVNADNKGVAGLERHLDHARGLRHADRLGLSDRPALRTTLDIGVQHATEQELLQAVADFAAEGGAALIMDAETGAIRAAASVPTVDPAFPETWVTDGPVDRVQAGSYELGSVMKIATVAMALDTNIAGLDTLVAAHEPLAVGSTTFSDGPARRAPLTVADVFLKSSNVGVGRLARAVGTAQQRA